MVERQKMKIILKKFFSPNSKPTAETFPELVDCIIWMRFVLAVFFGIWVGHEKQNRGGPNILLGLNFIAFLPILYAKTFLGADQDSYGTKLMFPGIMQGMALSMLIWFYFYTAAHSEDEAAFVSAFSKILVLTNTDSASDEGGISSQQSVEDEPQIIAEDSEF